MRQVGSNPHRAWLLPCLSTFAAGCALCIAAWLFADRAGQMDSLHPGIVLLTGVIALLLAVALTAALLRLCAERKRLERLESTDRLTGLLNRSGFARRAETCLAAEPDGVCVAAVLDIDDFKFINDVYGHAFGDAALLRLAGSMHAAFSSAALLGRSGGDEFCILLRETDRSRARAALEAFVQTPLTFRYQGQEKHFSISLGYAEYAPSTPQSIDTLLHLADIALYAVKLRGKQGCLAYESSLSPDRRTQLGFALNDVSEHLPGAFLIYRADASDDQILFANSEMIKLAGCTDLDDFMAFTGRSFRALIHPDDRGTVEASIWRQITAHSDGANDYVQFRFAVKDGSFRPVLDHGRIVENCYFGRVFYVLIMDCGLIRDRYNALSASQSPIL